MSRTLWGRGFQSNLFLKVWIFCPSTVSEYVVSQSVSSRITIYVYTATVNKLYSSIHYELKNIKNQMALLYNVYKYIWLYIAYTYTYHIISNHIMISRISAKFLIGKLPSRCQDQRLSVALRVVDALQRSNDLTQSQDVEQIPPSNWKSWTNQIIQSLWIYLLSLVFWVGLNHKRKIISLTWVELSCFFGWIM